ncbi:MAG TPA: hypothetical protein VKA63_01320, partial [Candidatus Krumholzibacteria bacterium]|nr:hypothetical protein [Candidatus Krumholzibacteria bacterium]
HDWSLAIANGRQWLGLPVLVLIAGAIAAVAQELRSRRALATKLLLLGAIAACGFVFGFTPFSGDNGTHGWHYSLWSGQAMRFALPKLAMASVLAALGFGISRVSGALFWLFAVFMCAWSVALHVALPRTQLVEIVLFALFTLGVWITLSALKKKAKDEGRRSRTSAVIKPAFLVASVLLLTLWSHGAREFRELHRKKSYDLPYLHALQAPADEVIGVAMTQLRYPFYGRDLMHKVKDISCRACTREDWLNELREKKIDVVAVGQTPVQNLLEVKETDPRPWLNAEGAPFTALEGMGGGVGSGIELYRRISSRP